MNSWNRPRFVRPWGRRLATTGIMLLLGGCYQPYGDVRGELKALAQNLQGRVTPLGLAPTLPGPAIPLSIERDPFNASRR